MKGYTRQATSPKPFAFRAMVVNRRRVSLNAKKEGDTRLTHRINPRGHNVCNKKSVYSKSAYSRIK